MSTPHPKLFILSAAPVHHGCGKCWPRALRSSLQIHLIILSPAFTSSRSPSKIHSLFHYVSLDLFLLHAFSVSTLILVSLISPPPSLDSPKPLDLSSSFYPDRPLIFQLFSSLNFFFLVLGFSPFSQHCCWLRWQHVCRLFIAVSLKSAPKDFLVNPMRHWK